MKLVQMVFGFLMVIALFVGDGANAQEQLEPEQKQLQLYRDELTRFRAEFGGARALPEERFYLFGMGLRRKLLYRAGVLTEASTGENIRKWDSRSEVILPADYTVELRLKNGEKVRILEDEAGVWIEENSKRELIPGTSAPVHLPEFKSSRYPRILRVLHQELLVNVTTNGPVPNFFVYKKPWYRDGAMMAMAFKKTGNLDCIRDWILNLREPFDRNNAGEREADNLGQALYLISLVSDKTHPLVKTILEETAKFEQQQDGNAFIKGRSDFAEHPVYQTKWLKFGLKALGFPDKYSVPAVRDSYSALFWMDYKNDYVAGADAADRNNYPYLGWACDHFHHQKKSPISNQDYPLTWEAHASQAQYLELRAVGQSYVDQKLAAPHTWHAAEIFLYLMDDKGD